MKVLSEEIVSSLPTPLSDSYIAFLNENESHSFRKVHRLIDLIEVFCKLYTVGSMATFLHALQIRMSNPHNTLSEESFTKIKVMIATGLKSPSLGVWWAFARDITKILQELNIPHILPGAEEELLNKIIKVFEGNDNLLLFRNNYAHGGTPSDEICKKDFEKFWPILMQLIIESKSLREINIIICTSEGKFIKCNGQQQIPIELELHPFPNHIWFSYGNKVVDTFPILNFILKDNKIDFYFYNSLKDKNANYLNYPNAVHFKDANLAKELLKYVPIEEWKNIKNVEMDPFRQQVEMLTEVFKGRRIELKKISTFLLDEKNNFLCIWGPPGVGKSALLARCTQILRFTPEVRSSMEGTEYWPTSKIYIVEYFIRSGATDTAFNFFESVNKRLDHLFKLQIEFGKSDEEKQIFFQTRLQQISSKLKEDEQLLLIIDGLDEIKIGDPLLGLLPKLLPSKIKVIYGARPQQELRFSFYEQLFRENRLQFDLRGLSIADIRAVMMEHVSKYEMEQQYIEEILRISEGNPLYLKMLCLGLEQNIYKLNNSSNLPKGMDELYKSSLLRLEKNFPGSIQFLIYLAVAKDFVSPELISEWLQTDTTFLRNNLLYACLEFLYENPQTESLEDYQLFHESLREYLNKTYPTEILKCKERICDWSYNWKLPNGDRAFESNCLRYAMQFSTEHLFQSYLAHLNGNQKSSAEIRRNQLFNLTENEEWRALNFETCGNGESISKSYYYLQRILVREDVNGNLNEKFFSYAINRYLEPERMFTVQRNILMQTVKPEKLIDHFERIPSLAKMGKSDEDKMLLTMMPFWANEINNNKLPILLKDKITDWLENTQSNAVKQLWKKTELLFKD